MKLLKGILTLVLVLISMQWLFAQANFPTSLHATRQGKITWYGKDTGGYETLTNVPIADLGCMKCHPGTLADGTPVDPATYVPSCNDCHSAALGTKVEQAQCLKCHSRQATEINKLGLTDVHRTKGFVCTDCHTKNEMHGTGVAYASMFEPGATERKCETCHTPDTVPVNSSHTVHAGKLDCQVCHTQTVTTCYNCHLESQLKGIKRPYGVLKDFAFMGRDKESGKITTATYQSLTYNGTGFYAVGPYGSHSVQEKGKSCAECHNNDIVKEFNTQQTIQVTKWDATNQKIVHAKGMIPIPSTWKTSLKFDFLAYTGDDANPTTDPTKWTLLKSESDLNQMLYLEPLTNAQLGKLGVTTAVEREEAALPSDYSLDQNYPNPFNPTTTIRFALPRTAEVSLYVYDMRGVQVLTPLDGVRYDAGSHSINLRADNLASGVYVYQLVTPDFKYSRKMTVLK